MGRSARKAAVQQELQRPENRSLREWCRILPANRVPCIGATTVAGASREHDVHPLWPCPADITLSLPWFWQSQIPLLMEPRCSVVRLELWR